MISSETADKRCAIWPLISVIVVYVLIILCPLKEVLSPHIISTPKISKFPKISTFFQNKHISSNKHTFLDSQKCTYYEWAQNIHLRETLYTYYYWI